MEKEITQTKLIRYQKWLRQIGVANTTGWRWRRNGLINVINIAGGLYITDVELAKFTTRAAAGDFSKPRSNRKDNSLNNAGSV